MESSPDFITLFQKLMDNACSPEEVDLLLEWLSVERDDGPVLQFIRSRLADAVPADQVSEEVRKRLEARLQNILREEIQGTKIISVHKPEVAPLSRTISLYIRRYAAIAACLLMLGTGVWFLLLHTAHRPEAGGTAQLNHFKNDVAPGSNKAILTLANGTTISLDSVKNGLLARQGGMKVVNLNSGQLAYSKSAVNADRVQGGEVQYNTISTTRGGQYRVTLPDGTKVWLNAASSLKFPISMTGKDRRVELTGEGYFEVTSDARAPFTVKTDGQRVLVLGTHFNINAYHDKPGIATTLLEGSVMVSHLSEDDKPQDGVVVRPGEQVEVVDGRDAIGVKKVDVRDVVAWKNGFFSFHRDNVQAIMKQLSRWYDVDVKYQGVVTQQDYFTGKIDRNLSLAQVLKILERTKVHFKIEEDKRIVILP